MAKYVADFEVTDGGIEAETGKPYVTLEGTSLSAPVRVRPGDTFTAEYRPVGWWWRLLAFFSPRVNITSTARRVR